MVDAGIERVAMPIRSALHLDPRQVHVWHARLKNLPVMEADSPVDHRDRVRQLRMGQKFVLRLLLGAYLEMPGRDVITVRGAGGKPVLAPPLARSGITFNLSHAGDCLAIAVGREMPVGIDIEHTDRKLRWQQLARRWFSKDEADWLETLEPKAATGEFLRLWTVREAMIKAMGATIAGHISRVTPEPGNPARIRSMPEDWPEAQAWTLHELDPDSGMHGWLAVPVPLASIRTFELGMP